MKPRPILLTLYLFILALMPILGTANTEPKSQSEAVEAAQLAVRRAIRTKLGSDYTVAFEAPTQSLLSFSETTVSGEAHANRGDDWRLERSFTYKVKAKNDGSKVRDLEIKFSNGDRYVDRDEWDSSHHKDEYLHFTKPQFGDKLDSRAVTFEGYCQDDVTITVYDDDNRRVAEGRASENNGRFRKTFDLPQGKMRALVRSQMSTDSEEVRFSVQENSDNWGTPPSRPGFGSNVRDTIEFRSPQSGESVSSPFTIQGQSQNRRIQLRVLDSRNREVLNRVIIAQNGFWMTRAELDRGDYHMEARTDDGGYGETRRFSVKSSSTSTRFRITNPKEGQTTSGPRINIEGNSSERSVRVQLWDVRGNRILDRSVSTRDGYFNTEIALDDGNYRVEVRSGDDQQAFNFRVSGSSISNPKASLRVTDPRRDSTVSGPRVTVAGNSTDSEVRVQVWDDRNNQVTQRSVPTRDGYFNTSIPLEPGRYRIRVETRKKEDYEEFSIRVGGDSSRSYLTLESPKKDSTVKGTRVTISGRSSGRSVNVRIWDDRNNQIASRDVPTRDEYWNTQIQLSNGRYRVKIMNDQGKGDEFWFTVK